MKNRQRMIGLLIGVLGCLPSVLPAQISVITITDGSTSVTSTNKVALTPLGGFDPQDLAIDQQLSPGDELTSRSEEMAVVLRCGSDLATATEMTLSAPFRVALLPGDSDTSCAVSLQGGTVDIVAGSPTEIQAGEVTLGSERTQFGMTVSRSGSKVNREAFVYEGRASLRRARRPEVRLSAGNKVAVSRSASLQPVSIQKADIVRAAWLYARADLSRSGLERDQWEKSFRDLAQAHAEVLEAPDKAEPKVALAVARMNLNVAVPSTIQYLSQAENLTSTNSKSLASATYLKGLAYQRLGESQAASHEFKQAQRVDPAIDEGRISQIYKIDPKVLQRWRAPQLAPQAPGGLQIHQ